jgi:uncharacterized membrane protein
VLKVFFIKLIAITISIIIIINTLFNIFFADKFEVVQRIISLNKPENFDHLTIILRTAAIKQIQTELKKDKILTAEEVDLINKFSEKIKKELEKSK